VDPCYQGRIQELALGGVPSSVSSSPLPSITLPFPLAVTHTHLTAIFSGTTWASRYQKGKTNLDFTGARDCEWQWHQLGHMQVCTSLQTEKPRQQPTTQFLQAGCPSCRPTNSVKALKALPLAVRSPLNQLAGLGELCKLPSGVRGGTPTENEFGAL